MTITNLIPFPNIDPILFSYEVFGFNLAIRWYALAYIAGFLLAAWWIGRLIRKLDLWKDGTPPLTKLQIDDLLTWMIIGTILGGRIGYVLFYDFSYFAQTPLR